MLSGEKDTEFEKRSYLLYSSFVSHLICFLLDPGSSGEELVNLLLLFVVLCKRQSTSFLFSVSLPVRETFILVFRVDG